MSDFSVKPVLTGDRTVLRPFTEADSETMWEIIGDPEVERFTGESPAELTPERVRAWYGSRSAQPDRPTSPSPTGPPANWSARSCCTRGIRRPAAAPSAP